MAINVLKPFNKKVSEKEIRYSETQAAKELDEFCASLAERYDIVIVPQVIMGFDLVRGIQPVNSKIDVLSNKRLNKK